MHGTVPWGGGRWSGRLSDGRTMWPSVGCAALRIGAVVLIPDS